MSVPNLENREIETFQSSLLSWAIERENLREFPWRETTSTYEVLVAEILLGATLAQKVVPIYEEFIERYPDFEALAAADSDELSDLLEPLGLQNRRAKAFVSIGEKLADQNVPEEVTELTQLPYVGQYAANATLCFGMGYRRPIVDANVLRVYQRAFGAEFGGIEDSEAWEFAKQILPEDQYEIYNLALLDFGAEVCRSSTPRCGRCFYTDQCLFYQNSVEDDKT